MVETVFTVTGEAVVAEAAALMAEKRVSCLPISMGQGAVGVVTEKDIIQKVVASGKDPRRVRVKEIMSTPLILAPSTITIKEAAEKMLSHQIRRLVITDEKGKLVGLATMTDIIRWIAQGQGNPNYIVRYLSDVIG
jgi:malate dehydrogenase (oxaloacetate-decarboxylating)